MEVETSVRKTPKDLASACQKAPEGWFKLQDCFYILVLKWQTESETFRTGPVDRLSQQLWYDCDRCNLIFRFTCVCTVVLTVRLRLWLKDLPLFFNVNQPETIITRSEPPDSTDKKVVLTHRTWEWCLSQWHHEVLIQWLWTLVVLNRATSQLILVPRRFFSTRIHNVVQSNEFSLSLVVSLLEIKLFVPFIQSDTKICTNIQKYK